MQDLPPIIVLAGGFGTRVRELFPFLPKGLIPYGIDNKPFLSWQFENLFDLGFRKFIYAVHYLADDIIHEMSKYQRYCDIDFVFEGEPLGTGGAVANVMRKFAENKFFVINGDIWCDFEPEKMLEQDANYNLVTCLAMPFAEYGEIVADGNVIQDLIYPSSTLHGRIMSGISMLSADEIKQYHGNFSLEKDFLRKKISQKQVYATHYDDYLIDIGTPRAYSFHNMQRDKIAENA